jgi:hypothetical protein
MIRVNCLITTSGKEGRVTNLRTSLRSLSQAGLADSFPPLFCHGGPRHERKPASGLHPAASTYVPLFDCHVPHAILASSSYFGRYFSRLALVPSNMAMDCLRTGLYMSELNIGPGIILAHG